MRKMRQSPKIATITAVSTLIIVMLVHTAIAQPKPITVKSTTGVKDENGAWLLGDGSETSDLIQLINAGPDGVINPPDENGDPSGDDSLICNIRIGEGYPFRPNEGKFSHGLSLDPGTVIYCRAWNAASPSTATYYGNSSIKKVTAETGDYDFGTWSTNTFFQKPTPTPTPTPTGVPEFSPLGIKVLISCLAIVIVIALRKRK